MARLTVTRRTALGYAVAGAGALAWPGLALAQDDATAIDAIVEPWLGRFDIPGLAIAIVRPGSAPYLKGYGVRTLGKAARVDAHTRFGIASNSKSFTAACIALLVADGKLAWDDPVRKHLPEFRMKDPVATENLTVRELLVHNSGLALGAGDLMQFPASDRPASDALKALPYLPFARGFRTGYAYDNILYVVADLLIERVSGKPWHAFVAERLLRPIGMTDAVPALRFLKTNNVAGRHARLGPPVRGMGAVEVIAPDEGPMTDAAGGINASVTDIAKWLQVQLSLGRLPDGSQLWPAEASAEMWTPRTIVAGTPGPTDDLPQRGVTQTYALGWFVQDYRGERLIHHSGGLSGQITQTALLPHRGIGVAVFTNTEDGPSSAIRNALLDHLIGASAFDWPAAYAARVSAGQAEALASVAGGIDTAPPGKPSLPLAAYAGRYRDPWYGDVVVAERGGALQIDFVPTPVFKSALEPWGTDSFRTRFPKGAGEDAVVSFAVAGGKVTGVTMKPLSPLADFSYDFHDLAFEPVT
ncbi:serine hydrolase [Sphingomonas japonica]|uniref:CubicO group peptidase (Beta-lactamase class C family) n=1 Tax=Sphingomonas japonica TaxID=511662 RepID=A0ABX0U3B9_9SPHN|nr:serine hydrolase [Sphingomonas japonica]NIJ23802.1 CubicO group peptidase (beta-lactamase class C family) [Sphingomonas japonica]